MTFHHAVLLVTVLVVLAAAADPASDLELSPTVASDRVTETFLKRLLRAHTTTAEERGFFGGIPGLDKLKKVFSMSKKKDLQAQLKTNDNLGDAFRTLGLSAGLKLGLLERRR
ncbi:secreted RxLR effector peptide protein, putative [Phytophthora infestans T30-4]|uniref:RxLR effector protein n=2 Tax=Phytophthora infestans TaxID=4787 RepID=D0N4T4_PHYIT|nr:secreted RxLR effector peptide protein, putative [Phytophthora infestans T30-4]EEY69892.1 secreted RxLR effector peptide protein, putative [Phytophthora infestans T30-4]KAF4038695.1 hypothetical protein GN244_ATG09224 [Phytophthora infestans]KAF4137351.1 hypothetical protein GN958_ATG13481 [Phytophthora infestans]|eukprot:XP_002998539.1 secreted RxLR effector peptide protein, putative [Phytophthora infestans T30-4]